MRKELVAVAFALFAVLAFVVKVGRFAELPGAEGDAQRNTAWPNDFGLAANGTNGAALSFRNARGFAMHARRFTPSTQPIGRIYLFHGYAEHLGRHKKSIDDLLKADFEVFALDHQGHGLSGGPIAVDAFDVVNDAADFIRTAQQTAPSTLPQFILAHSMGAAISLGVALRHRDLRIDGLALTGPAIFVDPEIATPLKVAIAGSLGNLLPNLPMLPPVTDKIWHDAEIRRQYDEDPLVYHGSMPALFAATLLNLINEIQRDASSLTKPFIVVHGERDTLCPIKGSEQLVANAKSTDKQLVRVADAMHEVLWLQSVRSQIVAWFESHVGLKKTS